MQPLTNPPRLRTTHLVAILAVLAPVGYLIGRFSAGALAGTYFQFITPVVVATSLGALAGIPIGLFFGSLRPTPAGLPASHPHLAIDNLPREADILAQIKQELSQIKILFDARKGDQTVLARIAYPTEFWDTLKASGQLFVVRNPALLNTIAGAYYWVGQANHLETMAFEARYSAAAVDNQNAYTHLIADARLLDGPLDTSLNAALTAIDSILNPPR